MTKHQKIFKNLTFPIEFHSQTELWSTLTMHLHLFIFLLLKYWKWVWAIVWATMTRTSSFYLFFIYYKRAGATIHSIFLFNIMKWLESLILFFICYERAQGTIARVPSFKDSSHSFNLFFNLFSIILLYKY